VLCCAVLVLCPLLIGSPNPEKTKTRRIGNSWVLDATVRGGLARFINHSCDPNCYTDQYYAPGGGTRIGTRIGIFARKQIQPGQELFYDYRVRVAFP